MKNANSPSQRGNHYAGTPHNTANIAAIVAAFDGAVLTKDADGRPHGFTLPGEARVWITYDGRKHRVHVSGCWPHSRVAGETHKTFCPYDLYPRPDSPSISISAAKSAEAVAAEIKRRFLPAYSAVLARCLEARQRHEDYVADQNAVARKIAGLLGVALRQGDRATSFDLPANLTAGSAYGSIQVEGSHVGFEIKSLPAAQAEHLIEFLKTL